MADNADPQRIRGAGDAIAKITDSLGIHKCVPCSQRQDFLNKYVPFPKISDMSVVKTADQIRQSYLEILNRFRNRL